MGRDATYGPYYAGTFSVDASGVVLHDTYRSAFSTYGLAIRFDPGTGLLYADDGRVIDPATGRAAHRAGFVPGLRVQILPYHVRG
jgi:hypothetical protein